MAIAGWLVIGLALLIIVAVVNNSWQPLFDQFRQAISGPGPQPAQGSTPVADSSSAPVPFEQSGIHEGTSRGLVSSGGSVDYGLGMGPNLGQSVGAGTGVEAVPVP